MRWWVGETIGYPTIGVVWCRCSWSYRGERGGEERRSHFVTGKEEGIKHVNVMVVGKVREVEKVKTGEKEAMDAVGK